MIPLTTTDGWTFWVPREYILCVWDDPPTGDTTVKVDPRVMAAANGVGGLINVTQSAAEIRSMYHQAQFEVIPE